MYWPSSSNVSEESFDHACYQGRVGLRNCELDNELLCGVDSMASFDYCPRDGKYTSSGGKRTTA